DRCRRAPVTWVRLRPCGGKPSVGGAKDPDVARAALQRQALAIEGTGERVAAAGVAQRQGGGTRGFGLDADVVDAGYGEELLADLAPLGEAAVLRLQGDGRAPVRGAPRAGLQHLPA